MSRVRMSAGMSSVLITACLRDQVNAKCGVAEDHTQNVDHTSPKKTPLSTRHFHPSCELLGLHHDDSKKVSTDRGVLMLAKSAKEMLTRPGFDPETFSETIVRLT